MDLDPLFIRNGLIVFLLLVVSIVFHEWGHAIAAHLLGDDTPRNEGRVTLNPMSHLDLVGTVLIPLLNIFVFGAGGFAFIGWGKPVMTNPSNFRHRWRDDLLVSMAGPATNLLLALLTIVAGSFLVGLQPRFGELIKGLVVMNVGLAVFNLLPIPPLDGGAMLRRLIGISDEAYLTVSRWSGLVLLLVINISVTRNAIGLLVAEACVPYAVLCNWISPAAFALIFRV
jgi:Zn-dependent protease